MADPELAPLKICSKCGRQKLASRDFFSPAGPKSPNTLRRKCKACCAADAAEWRRANPEKQAAAIRRRSTKGQWRPEFEEVYPLRRCPNCRQAKPNNPEFFSRGLGRDGLNSWCKQCHADDYEAKKPERLAQQKAYHSAARAKDPEKFIERNRRWRTNNREKHRDLMRAAKAKRRAQIREAGGTYTARDIAAILKAQKRRCWWCGCKLNAYHIDHRISLARGGSNGPGNLVASCAPCNQKKNTKMPWEIENPRLL